MEDTSFDAYQQQPTAARLAEVLKARQDHVYNICFQILRHPEDAEDAAQEVLLELARGIAKIGSPRQLKVWLYRVAVHSALDRKEARTRAHELARKRAAAPPTEGCSMDSEERAALMRAIGGLDDRTRCILLEHYFDKLTLEEIGAREGVSNVAIWKRLDRAKGQLRRALMGAGFWVAAAGLAHSLESLTPVAAPAGLAGKAALAAAGGIVVGTKSVVGAGTIVAAVLLVGAASTGGYLVGNARGDARLRDLQAEVSKLSTARTIAVPAPQANHTAGDVPAPAAPLPPSAPEAKPEASHAKGKPAEGRTPIVDPAMVRYGRPEKLKQDDLLNAETWDEFYKRAREKQVGATVFEDLIFQRAARDLGFDTRQTQALRSLFDSERIETTRAIVENAGGPDGFAKLQEDFGMNSKAILDDWRRQREVVRAATHAEYLKLLTYEQLAFFNEHLRNSEIGFEVSYGPEHVHYFIIGVGKK